MILKRQLFIPGCILLIALSSVSVYGWVPDSQVQASGVSINDDPFPPQSAFFFSVQTSGSGETENLRNNNNLSETNTDQDPQLVHDVRKKLLFEDQESYRKVSDFIDPGLGIRELIFPFHFHT